MLLCSDELVVVKKGKSPEHPAAQSAHVVCGSQRLPNISDFFSGQSKERTIIKNQI